jgi:hypothetical protein
MPQTLDQYTSDFQIDQFGASLTPQGPVDPVPDGKKSVDFLQASNFFNNKLSTSYVSQNENLFKQYRSVAEKGTEKVLNADYGFNPLIDNEDYYAQQQSGLEKFGKGLLKLPLYTATKLGSGVGFITGLINPFNWFDENGYISAVADNGISNFFDSWENDIKNQWLPAFQEAEDRNKGFFSRAFTDIDFWSEDVVDGLAFMASAWIPGMALSKVGAGVKAINALAKLGLATEGASSVAGTIEAVGATTNYFKNAVKYAEYLDKFNSWAIATSSEAMFEAKGVKDDIMKALENSSFTEDQKKRIAGDNARNAFLMNAALLGVTNVFELPLVSKILNKTEGVAKGIKGGLNFGEEVAVKEATTKVGKFLQSGYGRFSKDVVNGIFREGIIEENGQLAIQRFNTQYGTKGKVADMLDFNTYKGLGEQYYSQTKDAFFGEKTQESIETSTSIGLGGILGGGQTAIANRSQTAKNKLTTEEAVDYYNRAQQSWLKFGNIYETEEVTSKDENGNDIVIEKIKLDQSGQPIMDKQKLAGITSSVRSNAAAIDITDTDTNISRRNMVRDNAFADFVLAHINANMEGTLLKKLDSIAKSSPEDLAKLGFAVDDTLNEQLARYKTLASNIIKQNKIINNDIIFDGSKEDLARKARLTELAAQQAVYRGLAAEEQNKYNDIRNEMINSENSSLSDGLVDQLNAIKLRIISQEQYIKELKSSPDQLTKSQVTIAETLLDNLNDKLTQLKKNNETSVKTLSTFNNGLYQYEKEERNNIAFLNPLYKKMKYKGELDNHIESLGQEWGYYADFENGKKNFLDMFIEEQIRTPINNIVEEENKQAELPPATSPSGPTGSIPPAASNQTQATIDPDLSYSYQGSLYNIMMLGNDVIMMNVKSADENNSLSMTQEEFQKALAEGKVVPVKPPQTPKIESKPIATQQQPTSAKTYPDDLETFLQQEYNMAKEASEAQNIKIPSYAEWKKTAGVALTKLWMSKKGQQQSSNSTAPVSDVITDDIYNNYIDKNIIPNDVLNSIADKIIARESLSQRETAIFSGKTSEINEIIRKKASTAISVSDVEAEKQNITSSEFKELVKLVKFFLENPKEPTVVGSVVNKYPALFKAITDIERRRKEELKNLKEFELADSYILDYNRHYPSAKYKQDFKRMNELTAQKEKYEKIKKDFKYFEDQLITEDKINAKYDAELAALEGAKPAEETQELTVNVAKQIEQALIANQDIENIVDRVRDAGEIVEAFDWVLGSFPEAVVKEFAKGNISAREQLLSQVRSFIKQQEQGAEQVSEQQAPGSTLEKELEDLGNQLRKDLGFTTELRFMKPGSIGYDKEGNKYQVVSKKDKYGRSLEYRKNDGPEQSFNPKTASNQASSALGYYPEAFTKLYSKNPKSILDKYNQDKAIIEAKYAQMQTEPEVESEEQQEEDTSNDVKDFVQDINQYRTQSNKNNTLANAEYQEGYRQVAPSNSLANTTDIVNVVEFATNQIRYERGEVNKNYVFDVATSSFMPGHSVTFKVMVSGFEQVVNRLTGEKYDKSALYDENLNAIQNKYDFIPIGVFANIRGKETMIGTIHEPQWIEYKIREKYPHIAIPEDQLDQAVPEVVKQEVIKNRELRKLILDSYNKNHNFVIQGIVEDKSMGILRTTESIEPISKRLNPRIAEGGIDNRHGVFAIVRDGSIQSDRNVAVDNIIATETFSPQNIADYQGVAVLMLPTPVGQWYPSFIKLPNVSVDQANFIIEAWKAFTGQTNNPEMIDAVYEAMGLTRSADGFAIGILRQYIDHYITQVDSKNISRTGNGTDVRPGSARINITTNGELELQVKDVNGEWFATKQPITKAEQLPVDYLYKMTNLRTTIKFTNVKNDSLKGINSTEKATILSIINGKLVKEKMMYNQYIMDRAGTFVDKGIQSKNAFSDWVYFANPVVKMGVTGVTDPNEGIQEQKETTPAPTVEQVNTPREDKGAALLAALKAKKLQEQQVEEQKENCSGLRGKLDKIM